MKLGFILSKENLKLSEIEAESIITKFLNGKNIEILNNLIIADFAKKPDKKILDRLAYAKICFEIDLITKDIETAINNIISGKLNIPETKKKNTFKITKMNLEHAKRAFVDLGKAVRAISLYPGIGKVNLENPDIEILFIKTKQIIVGKKIWENTDKFDKRRGDKRPANHPTTMSPKLAKALINIAGAKKEVLDPFCGAGGILLEAGLLGLKCTGIDIDPEMIVRAKKNLAHFNINSELYNMDCMNYTKKSECAVTDIPYGKSSKLGKDLKELAEEFLNKYSLQTKSIVLVHPSTINIDHIKKQNLHIKKQISYYVHNSLTRTISILED